MNRRFRVAGAPFVIDEWKQQQQQISNKRMLKNTNDFLDYFSCVRKTIVFLSDSLFSFIRTFIQRWHKSFIIFSVDRNARTKPWQMLALDDWWNSWLNPIIWFKMEEILNMFARKLLAMLVSGDGQVWGVYRMFH